MNVKFGVRMMQDASPEGKGLCREELAEKIGTSKLPANKQSELFNVMDAYLQDYRTSIPYVK